MYSYSGILRLCKVKISENDKNVLTRTKNSAIIVSTDRGAATKSNLPLRVHHAAHPVHNASERQCRRSFGELGSSAADHGLNRVVIVIIQYDGVLLFTTKMINTLLNIILYDRLFFNRFF